MIVIDGHNLVNKVEPYLTLKKTRMEDAVAALVGDLINLAGLVDEAIIVVFDGRDSGSESSPVPRVRVIYSAGGRTADSVIERLVFERAQDRTITVYTADMGLRNVVWRPGVRCVSPEGLVELMRELTEEARSKPPGDTRLRVEDRLTEEAKEKLDKLRHRRDFQPDL